MPAMRTRTPKKAKAWVQSRTGLQALTTNNVEVFHNLLSSYETDVGAIPAKTTVMRIIGDLYVGNSAAASVVSDYEVFWGIAWLPNRIASLAAGDASIPDPGHVGVRETEWLQLGRLSGTSVNGTQVYASNEGQLDGTQKVDIRQMRTRPTATDQLCIVTRSTGQAAEFVQLSFYGSTMIALP